MTIAITEAMVEAYASATVIERGTYAPDLIRQGLDAVVPLLEKAAREVDDRLLAGAQERIRELEAERARITREYSLVFPRELAEQHEELEIACGLLRKVSAGEDVRMLGRHQSVLCLYKKFMRLKRIVEERMQAYQQRTEAAQ